MSAATSAALFLANFFMPSLDSFFVVFFAPSFRAFFVTALAMVLAPFFAVSLPNIFAPAVAPAFIPPDVPPVRRYCDATPAMFAIFAPLDLSYFLVSRVLSFFVPLMPEKMSL